MKIKINPPKIKKSETQQQVVKPIKKLQCFSKSLDLLKKNLKNLQLTTLDQVKLEQHINRNTKKKKIGKTWSNCIISKILQQNSLLDDKAWNYFFEQKGFKRNFN